MEEREYKAHVMVLPAYGQGHMNPMLQFSKRLMFKGVKVTVLTMLSTTKAMKALVGSITLESIYDDFTEGGPSEAGSYWVFREKFKASVLRNLPDIIQKYESSKYPIKCLVYISSLYWALDVAKEFGLIAASFFTQSCTAIASYFPIQKEVFGTCLPEPPMVVPRLTEDAFPDYIFAGFPIKNIILEPFTNIEKSDLVLFNSFDMLEDEVVKWMTKLWPLRTIGPTIPSIYLDNRVEGDREYGFNVFQPKTNICMEWLNTKEKGSVIYVSIGSVAALTTKQNEELAWALRLNKNNFLWVVRESEQNKLPSKFMDEIFDKGLVVPWCSQLEVLAHEAVGCFVTHCGWNSTMEGLSFGVPMVVMPVFLDQFPNAHCVEEVWGVGIRPKASEKSMVTRDEIDRCITEVMEGERAKEIKRNASRWKEMAKVAVDEGGSSDKNIDEFIALLLGSS